ncbi:MAG: 3-dehydroquinate synthase family protein, partial [Candidatus Acidiferrales bacterium]
MASNAVNRVQVLRVHTPTASYPVVIGAGLLRECGQRLRRLSPGRPRLFVISSPRVWRLWGRPLAAGLRAASVSFDVLLMHDREKDKRLATVEKLADELLTHGADRGSLLAAFGGGVVGDVTGFLATTYMRGVSYIQIPTTLVAQADAALGGKTGVNLRAGKNLLGAFHHPQAVFADTTTLATLPGRDYRAGLYEVVKCAVIGDPFLFRFLEQNLLPVVARHPGALQTALVRAMRLKARIVSRDEHETHLR